MTSWVESANLRGSDFPLENLPYGAIGSDVVVAIGDYAFRVREAGSVKDIMGLPAGERIALRQRVQALLDIGETPHTEQLISLREVTLSKPVEVGDYTDFYASIFHATNVGRMFRPDNPLLPNYKYVPIGYHGRASSLVASGTEIRRPNGQTQKGVFGPSKSLDYELEVGFYIAGANRLGDAISVDEAESRIFGFSLVNDWSARDIQSWEYQPLGPFLSKSFATTVSPWIVTMDALAPFRAPAFRRPDGDPDPLPYLDSAGNRSSGAIDMTLEVWLASAGMRERGMEAVRVCRSNLRDLYWTPAQMVTHHASNGCNLRPGDLLATGTVSGDSPRARGCLLEMTRRGEEPLELPSGEKRVFLEDGDEVVLRGYCEKPGVKPIGLGECRGTVSS